MFKNTDKKRRLERVNKKKTNARILTYTTTFQTPEHFEYQQIALF